MRFHNDKKWIFILTPTLLLGASELVHAIDSQATSPSTANVTTQQLGEIEVIGSHIRNIDLETQHPILVLERVDIERTGLTSISDIVQSIVANGETLNRNINNNNINHGAQEVNLRSLGSNRTLVLVNGARWVSQATGSVDLSGIPLALVERVEVLLDGASAIYGSDAIGGVINIITRKDFEGGELGAYFGQTSHDDGERRSYDLSFGHKSDNWSASGGIEYSRDDPIFAGNRAISAVPVYGLPAGATGSFFTPYSFLVPDSYLDGFENLGNPPLQLISGRPGKSPNDFRAVDFNQDLYNYAPLNYLQTPQQRRAIFAQARYEFSSSLALSADVLFNQRHSAQQLAPSDILIDTTNPFSANAIAISPDNVYNPFGEPIDVAVRRFSEAGPRIFEQTNNTKRLHMALDGQFVLFGRDWAWGADAAATRSDEHEFTGPYADDRKLAPALGPSFVDASGSVHCGTPTAPIAGCVSLDLFGPPGSITPAMLAYVDVFENNRKRTDSRDFDVHLSANELAALPAGPLGFAAGIEHRRESGATLLDPLESSGNVNGNGVSSSSTSGAYSVTEAYVEFDAPLLADKPFARKLDLTAGSRYSNYSNFGGSTNSQLGLRWKPVDDLLVRANAAQGFRAPAITELFQGATQFRDFGITDPCDARNMPTPAISARCQALGVPANVHSDAAADNVSQIGNPNLQPETSRSRGIGFVYTPSWLEGFNWSLDWYDIRIRNAIGDPGYQATVYNCYARNSDSACALITRSGNGTISHVTDFDQNVPGGVETEGYDLALSYRHDTPLGLISARWNTNYVDYFGEIGKPVSGSLLPDGSSAQGNVVGLNSPNLAISNLFGVIWRWRSQLQLVWDRAPWSASITGRYFSHINEDCSVVINLAQQLGNPNLANLCSNPDRSILISGNPVPENRVPSVTLTDIEGSWDAPWRGRITLGVRNAFNRSPPVSYSSANSFFPDYDVPGRFFYASYRQKF